MQLKLRSSSLTVVFLLLGSIYLLQFYRGCSSLAHIHVRGNVFSQCFRTNVINSVIYNVKTSACE